MNGVLAFVAREAAQQREPSKKSLQKLVYFLQERGVPLGFRFGFHLFGPYSSSLANTVDDQVIEGVLGYKQESMSTLVVEGPAGRIAIKNDELEIARYREEILEVLRTLGGKSPLELELLSTIDYMKKTGVKRDTVELVQSVKGSKFTEDAIKDGEQLLKRLGYIT